MGRLTLNILLSFAQFEREVTGERIRDKIAASKRKGMWMGGVVPLGYRVADRLLVVDTKKKPKSCKRSSQPMSNRAACRSSRYISKGSASGARSEIARPAERLEAFPSLAELLYALLQNKLYLGEMPHKDQVYPGQHKAIVSRQLWETVQTQIEEQPPRDTQRRDSRPRDSSGREALRSGWQPVHTDVHAEEGTPI